MKKLTTTYPTGILQSRHLNARFPLAKFGMAKRPATTITESGMKTKTTPLAHVQRRKEPIRRPIVLSYVDSIPTTKKRYRS